MSASQLQFLTERLTELYRRPTRVIYDYCEELMLAAVSSRPGVMDELAEIMEFRSRLPTKEKRFFPRSLTSLLSKWQEVLDQARTYEPNPQEQTLESRQADAFIRRMEREV